MQNATHSPAAENGSVCPVCDGTEFEQSVDDCPPFCTECGYVVRSDHDPDLPLQSQTAAEPTTTDDATWAETYRVENATQKRLAEAFEQLETISSQLDVATRIRQTAAEIYCAAFKQELTDGRAAEVVIAVCVLFASRQHDRSIPRQRLIECAAVEQSAFRACRSATETELESDEFELKKTLPAPADYIPFLAKSLELSQQTVADAQRRLEIVSGNASLMGKNPAGIAAAAVYVAADEQTQVTVSEAVGVSTETIRKRVAQLTEVVADD